MASADAERASEPGPGVETETAAQAGDPAQAIEAESSEAAAHAPESSHEPVSPTELNAWRRGFTPQAEIWNGRLAMLGLSVGLTVLLLARLAMG